MRLLTEKKFADIAPRLSELETSLGGWRLEPAGRVLTQHRYEVDLDRCRTSAEVLDWICQVAQKTWATNAVLAGLVRALCTILQPQATMCPFGRERRLATKSGVHPVRPTNGTPLQGHNHA